MEKEQQERKEQINIRVFGKSGVGKSQFFKGMLQTFCFSGGILKNNHLYSIETPGEAMADKIAYAKSLYRDFGNTIGNTAKSKPYDVLFKISGENDFKYQVNFYDYKGGNVVVEDSDEAIIQAQVIDNISKGDILFVLVDSIELAKSIIEYMTIKGVNTLDQIISDPDSISYCRNAIEVGKYALILQNLLEKMPKEECITIAFLLTKTDSAAFHEDENNKYYRLLAENEFSNLRIIVEKIYEIELFLAKRHGDWYIGIFPIAVFGRDNVMPIENTKIDAYSEQARDESIIQPEGIERAMMFSMQAAFEGIVRSIEREKIEVKDCKFKDCNNLLSALRIDCKKAGSWRQIKNNYYASIHKNQELSEQEEKFTYVHEIIINDFEKQYEKFCIKDNCDRAQDGTAKRSEDNYHD